MDQANKSLNINYGKKVPFKLTDKPVRINDNHSDITTLQYDPQGLLFAVGCFDGTIKIYSALTNKVTQVLNPAAAAGSEPNPISSLRWRPNWSGTNLKSSTVLTAVYSDGLIQTWNTSNNQLLNEIPHHRDRENSLYACDYNRDGKKVIVGGKDRKLYIYDATTRDLIGKMHSNGAKVDGHINRIFCIKGHPDDNNVVASAGWDGMVKLYDLRKRTPFASLGGAQVSGDSIDMFDDMIVCGSYKNKDVMKTYSLSQQKLIHTWEFQQGSKDLEAGYVFSTKFSNDGNFIISGGAGKNELKVFTCNSDSAANYKAQMEIKDLPSPVFSISVNPNPNLSQFAFGLSNGQIYSCNYEIDKRNQEQQEMLAYGHDFARVAKEFVVSERRAAPVYKPNISTFLTKDMGWRSGPMK